MSLSTEIRFILQGGGRKEITRKDGRYTEKFLNFLADNQIPY